MVSISYRDPTSGNFVPLPSDTTPIGAIMGFGGSVAPDGWFICNGAAHGSAALAALIGPNTPDLRDRFIVGSSATKAIGATGGAASVTLSAAQCGVPAHAHGASSSTESVGHTHSGTFGDGAGGHHHANGYVMTGTKNTTLNETSVANAKNWPLRNLGLQPSAGAHTHSGSSGNVSAFHSHAITINASGAVNAIASHENRPPYYAMTFIIKGA